MKKVKYIGCSKEQINWGSNNNPSMILEVGKIYKVANEEMHSSHTKISLVGIEGKFNSVCFESV